MTDIYDYIDFENQKVVRTVAEHIFDGTDTWLTTGGSGSRPNYYRVLLDTSLRPSSSNGSSGTQVCNYFAYGAPTSSNSTNGIGVYISGGTTPYIRMRNAELTNSTLINEFCAEKYSEGNPVRLDWQLSTPIETSITLPEILLAKGTTIIGIGTTKTPPSASFTYKGSKF